MDIHALLMLTASMFFILNPFASLPIFVSTTKDVDPSVMKSYANKAVLVAAILLFVFVFIGQDLMGFFGVTMDSFRTAGGLVLILMGIEIVFGIKLSQDASEKGAPWVIIATPILSGPGIITAAILFSEQYGLLPVIVSSIIALIITWVLLRLSPTIVRYIGIQPLEIVSKIIGLLLTAMGVEYILKGVTSWLITSDVLNVTASVVSSLGII
ncbi:MAG: MarC family protein [Candidatus Methanomethylophilaceae archaeon]|nr:MarC family protein [Candidatus Methanomethylophilaceae archaeon]